VAAGANFITMKPSSASGWRTPAAAALAALVPLLVFSRGLRGIFFQGDLVVYYLPAYTYATRALRAGVLPLWAPEMEGGQPFHAQWEPTLLYPVDALFRMLLAPWWALNGSLLFHLALAAVGMLAYARRLSLSRPAALVSATVYAVNGFMMAHLEHPNLIVGAAWLPWLLLAVEAAWDGRRIRGVAGMALVLGMMLLGGHPDIFLMGALLAGLLLLLHPTHGVLRKRSLREALPALGTLLAGYGLGIALAAAQLLPTLELARLSWQRHSVSTAYQDIWSLRPGQFLVQLLPDLFGRNGQDTYWGMAHYWEECSYVGALALALGLVGLFSRHQLARFYAGLAAVSVWLAMGTNSVGFSLLHLIPAFGTMRLPCRYMFLFDLSVAILAGCGAHWLSQLWRPAERVRARKLCLGVGVSFVLAALWLSSGWLDKGQLLVGVAQRLRAMHLEHTREVGPLLARYRTQLGLDAGLLLGGLAVALLLLLVAANGHRWRRFVSPLAFAGIALTLLVFDHDYHSVIPARWIASRPFTVAAMRTGSDPRPFRILQWDSLKLHSKVARHRGWWPTDESGYRQYIASLPGNYNLVWALSGVRQEEWSALPLRYTRQLTSNVLANGERNFRSLEPYLRWWNTAYVISEQPLIDPALRLVAADRIHLYRTRDPGRRAWIVHEAMVEPDEKRVLQRLLAHSAGLTESVLLSEPGLVGPGWGPGFNPGVNPGSHPGDGASVVAHSPTRVTLVASAARDGYLVLGETWAPGWRAWVDGRPVAVLRANLIHRAVALAAGTHRVEFRYVPASFRLGLYGSAGALALLLALAVARAGQRG
jgi:hypothetical protein